MRHCFCSASAANFLFSKLRVLGGRLAQLLCQHGGAGSSTYGDCAAPISRLAKRSALYGLSQNEKAFQKQLGVNVG